MNAAIPSQASRGRPRSLRALTIMEMLVSTAMLSFIVLGLTAMLIQTQKAFKSGVKQATITDAGRSIVDMIASDLSQLSDPHFTNVPNPDISGGSVPPTLDWSWANYFVQSTSNNGVFVPVRTNVVEDIFGLIQTNSQWVGVGYAVSNWFTNAGASFPSGVGTLYRYVITTNVPLNATGGTNLINGFRTAVNGTYTNCYRIADGVVHLKLSAFNADGNENPYDLVPGSMAFGYPNVMRLPTIPITYQTNYLPHSIEIELGILEPEAFEHARALFTAGALNAASNYLVAAAGQVEIFRQHVIILAAP